VAQFNADINLAVNNSKALQGVNKVERAFNKLNQEAAKFEQLFGTQASRALNNSVVQSIRLRRALEGQKAAAAAFNDELARTARIYESIQRQQRALPAARAAAGALPPGRTAGLLPAAGGTSANSERAQFERAATKARAIDEANYRAATNQSIQAANNLTQAIEAEVTARRQAARQVTETTQKLETTSQKLLPPASQANASGPAGAPPLTATSRYGQKLQAEVDRQIQLTGKLNQETAERVAQYNKAQQSEDKLIKSTSI